MGATSLLNVTAAGCAGRSESAPSAAACVMPATHTTKRIERPMRIVPPTVGRFPMGAFRRPVNEQYTPVAHGQLRWHIVPPPSPSGPLSACSGAQCRTKKGSADVLTRHQRSQLYLARDVVTDLCDPRATYGRRLCFSFAGKDVVHIVVRRQSNLVRGARANPLPKFFARKIKDRL